MVGAKVAQLRALQVHHADQPVLGDQRHCQLRAHLWIGADVMLVGGNVVEKHRLARQGHLSHHAFADREARPFNLRRVANLESHAQFVGAVVQTEKWRRFGNG